MSHHTLSDRSVRALAERWLVEHPGQTIHNEAAFLLHRLLRVTKDYDEPQVETGRVICRCGCHQTCHLCGRPFVGRTPHINCADTVESGSANSWDYLEGDPPRGS